MDYIPDEVVGDLSAPPEGSEAPAVPELDPPDDAEEPDDELPEELCEFDAELALSDDPLLGTFESTLVST